LTEKKYEEASDEKRYIYDRKVPEGTKMIAKPHPTKKGELSGKIKRIGGTPQKGGGGGDQTLDQSI